MKLMQRGLLLLLPLLVCSALHAQQVEDVQWDFTAPPPGGVGVTNGRLENGVLRNVGGISLQFNWAGGWGSYVSFTLTNHTADRDLTFKIRSSYDMPNYVSFENDYFLPKGGGSTIIHVPFENIQSVGISALDPCSSCVWYSIDNLKWQRRLSTLPGAVIFVPGMAASKLQTGTEPLPVWPYAPDSWWMLGCYGGCDASPVTATDVWRNVPGADYGTFIEYLKDYGYQEVEDTSQCAGLTGDLFLFPYDWRRSNDETAAGLAALISCAKTASGKKVHIVAHSMGGVLARRTLLKYPQLVQDVEQVVTVGSSWFGAPKAITVLYTGEFFDSTFLRNHAPTISSAVNDTFAVLAKHFPGMHELLPTRAYFQNPPTTVGTPPRPLWPLAFEDDFVTVPWRMLEMSNYDLFVSELDAEFETHPGTNGKTFHDVPQQDVWSADPTNIPYTHFVGKTDKATTPFRLVVKRSFGPGAMRTVSYRTLKSVGDGTVPIISAARTPATRAARSRLFVINGTDAQAGHVELMSNPTVLARTLDLLRHPPTTYARGDASETEFVEDDPVPEEQILGSVDAVYMTLINSGDVTITDPAGRIVTTGTASTGEPAPISALIEPIGVRSFDLILDAGAPYIVSYVSNGEPVRVEVLVGRSNYAPHTATRYVDLAAPSGKHVQFSINASQQIEAKYDGDDADEIPDVTIPPSGIATGAGAADSTAPKLTLAGWPTVTITATDDLSGIARVLTSTDGVSYTTYTGPVTVASTVRTLFARAEDVAGNRSRVYRHPRTKGDFNSDGKTDLVWQRASDGTSGIWLLDGTARTSEAALPHTGAGWSIVGTDDFNNDGSADLVWQNSSSFQTVVWLMAGTEYAGEAALPGVSSSSWRIVGTGDFNGDEKADVVWQDSASFRTVVWLMNGTTYVGEAELPTVSSPAWSIRGIGDFNGDRKPDLVWRNASTFQTVVWLMNGTTYAGEAALPGVSSAAWNIEAAGDFNADGQADLVWRNAQTYLTVVWFMNGTVYGSEAPLPAAESPAGWRVAGPR